MRLQVKRRAAPNRRSVLYATVCAFLIFMGVIGDDLFLIVAFSIFLPVNALKIFLTFKIDKRAKEARDGDSAL